METLKGELTSFEALKDVKALLSTAGPCITVYMPLSNASTAGANPNAKHNELQWRECLRLLEDKVDRFGAEGRELLDSLRSWAAVAPDEQRPGGALAVFRAKDVFQVARLEEVVTERAVLGPHFYIRPLLPHLTRDNVFYLLALSQKNTRLLRCTRSAFEEIPLAAETKTDFDEWMNQVKPDHTAIYNGSTGPSSGASKGALAPKGSDREAKDEYLAHFCKQIDRGVGEALRGKTEPLILCAVEYEIPIYREVNNYPHLAKEEVHGAPNGLRSDDMHARSLEALDRCYATKVDDALGEWNHKVGGGASSRFKDVITAAHDGRVLTLLVSESLEHAGVFEEETHQVKGKESGGAGDEDLVNDAVVQTIVHAGKVLVAPHSKMPNGSAVAAIYRF